MRFQYTRYDNVVRWTILPLFALMLNFLLFGERFLTDWRLLGTAMLITLVLFLGHWFVNNAIALRNQRLYPNYHNFPKRILYTGSLCVLSSLSTTLLTIWIYKQLDLPLLPGRQPLTLVFVTLSVVFVTSVYECINAFEEWRRLFIESEQLKKAQLQSQLEALKQQVNPHFLFNSLNVLGVLIEDDPRQASTFLEELSTVYRYLLRSNEQDLTSLATELEFIQSYYRLLQTRHGDSLRLVTKVAPHYQHYQIPPLTLQLLIENAVKHNVILPEMPLVIQIATDAEAHLTVSNNLQRKYVRVHSNGVGLSNILTKYRVLGQTMPTVEEQDGQFVVKVPLVTA